MRMEEVAQWELHNLYSSSNIIKQIKSRSNEVGGACGTYGITEKNVHDFDGKARRKEAIQKTEA
jgi:hypothetical protein